ncbi:hypothetical protein Ciccas_011491 [Cichlidogyrus casuarinus]|uniref:Uncharacterized protein n=1 Tax=Cichlidogyrus casuarinus TaxID=1844966 RepID=A0ABD2PRR1_9PLAT
MPPPVATQLKALPNATLESMAATARHLLDGEVRAQGEPSSALSANPTWYCIYALFRTMLRSNKKTSEVIQALSRLQEPI